MKLSPPPPPLPRARALRYFLRDARDGRADRGRVGVAGGRRAQVLAQLHARRRGGAVGGRVRRRRARERRARRRVHGLQLRGPGARRDLGADGGRARGRAAQRRPAHPAASPRRASALASWSSDRGSCACATAPTAPRRSARGSLRARARAAPPGAHDGARGRWLGEARAARAPRATAQTGSSPTRPTRARACGRAAAAFLISRGLYAMLTMGSGILLLSTPPLTKPPSANRRS